MAALGLPQRCLYALRRCRRYYNQAYPVLKSKGGILEHRFELLEQHVLQGRSLIEDAWEGFDLQLHLMEMGGLLVEQHTKQVERNVANTLKGGAETSACGEGVA